MMKPGSTFGLSVLVLGGAMGLAAVAQSNTPATDPAAQSTPPAAQSTPPAAQSATPNSGMSADDKSTYATGKPLEQQSKEGFWGRMNPLARQKWVKRQEDPSQERTNERDQQRSKNAKQSRRDHYRATTAINKATT